ncbi:MAG TPA: hypothetical protein ENJ31_09420 [Anaerolineae bacterium]|nr:hypothetical protein [Anaerolineae bacterium]
MLKLLVHLGAGAVILFNMYTGTLTWVPCEIAAGAVACWKQNPILLPVLIMYTITAAIFVVGQLGEKRS